MQVSEPISRQHFQLWYDYFKTTSARFLSNPSQSTDVIWVHYEIEDMDEANRINEHYSRITTPIVEKKRSGWRLFFGRIRGVFK